MFYDRVRRKYLSNKKQVSPYEGERYFFVNIFVCKHLDIICTFEGRLMILLSKRHFHFDIVNSAVRVINMNKV